MVIIRGPASGIPFHLTLGGWEFRRQPSQLWQQNSEIEMTMNWSTNQNSAQFRPLQSLQTNIQERCLPQTFTGLVVIQLFGTSHLNLTAGWSLNPPAIKPFKGGGAKLKWSWTIKPLSFTPPHWSSRTWNQLFKWLPAIYTSQEFLPFSWSWWVVAKIKVEGKSLSG